MKSRLIQSHREEVQEVFNKKLGVIFNGEDNLKPFMIESLIDKSPTATQCAWIYQSFLGGGGFKVDLTKFNLSDKFHEFVNPDDLLFDVAESLSRHQGVFIHVSYDALFNKTAYKVIPYSLCRVGKKDSDDFSGKVLLSRKGWGKYLKKDELEIFDAYNPNSDVILKQVERDGGWHNYKGQVLFFKLSNKSTYPVSLIESAYIFADSEYNIGLFYNSTTKRGFNDITIVMHKPFDSIPQQQSFDDNARKVTGVENASSIWMIEDNMPGSEDTNVKFDKISSDQKPDRYQHIEQSSANFIRKAFKNIPPQLVDYIQGKLGATSGEDLIKAQSVYNSIISRDRLKVESLFKELFENYKEAINPSGDWTISQYSLLDDGTAVNASASVDGADANKGADQLKLEEQSNLRGSVGGVTGILSIQTSVAQKVTSYDSGIAMLEEIFGYETAVAERILGEPIELEKSNDTVNQ